MQSFYGLLTGVSSINNPGIEVFGFKIYYYAIIIVTGMIVAIFVSSRLLKKKGIDPDRIYTYSVVILPVAILCARLYLYLFPYKDETVIWSTFFNFRNGGLAIYGGIIGGVIAVIVTALIKKDNILDIIDCIAPSTMCAQAIGRWGNYVNQEAFGQSVTNPNLQWFPFSVYIENPTYPLLPGWYHATFFYESLWNIIGFTLILLLIYKTKPFLNRGIATACYFVWYGLGRLWIEGLRSDSLYFEFFGHKTDIKVSQLISVIAIIVGLAYLIYINRRKIGNLYRRLKHIEPLPDLPLQPVEGRYPPIPVKVKKGTVSAETMNTAEDVTFDGGESDKTETFDVHTDGDKNERNTDNRG